MTSKRKLKILTIAEKVDVINAVERSGKKNYEVANEFGIPSSTLSTIMKNKTKIMANFGLLQPGRKKMKPAEYPDLDACLFEWFVQQQQQQQQCRDGGEPVGGPALKRKADALAKSLGHSNFKNSTGWLDKWKKRNNVVLRRANRGGVANAPDRGDRTAYWRHCVSSAVGQYSADDIFAADETAVLYECLPGCRCGQAGRSACSDSSSSDSISSSSGSGNSNTCRGRRVTVLLCANMSGAEKARPLLVGERRRPRCFRGVRSVPVDYCASGPRARMTASLWDRWLGGFDETIAAQNRKVVLFVDGGAAPAPPRLTAVTVRFLPAAVGGGPPFPPPPKPLGPAVIRDFKTFYRTEVVRGIAGADGSARTFSVDLLRAARMIDKAWRRVTPQAIADGFRSAGFTSSGAADQSPAARRTGPGGRSQPLDPDEWSRVARLLDLKPGHTFGGYVEIDEDLPVCAAADPTDSEVAVAAASSADDSGDDECTTPKKITVHEASKALVVLRDFIETTEGELCKSPKFIFD